MAKIILHHGCAPAGASSASCTATLAHVLAPYTAVTSDSNNAPGTGTLETYSGVTSISPSTEEQTFNTNGLYLSSDLTVNAMSQYTGVTSITPATSSQTFSTNGLYVGSNLTVNAIPSQKSDSGNVTLNGSTTSKSYAAGWYSNAHGAQVSTYTWS